MGTEARGEGGVKGGGRGPGCKGINGGSWRAGKGAGARGTRCNSSGDVALRLAVSEGGDRGTLMRLVISGGTEPH